MSDFTAFIETFGFGNLGWPIALLLWWRLVKVQDENTNRLVELLNTYNATVREGTAVFAILSERVRLSIRGREE